MARKIGLSVVVLAIANAGLAAAGEPSTAPVVPATASARVVSDDGALAVTLPCAKEDARSKTDNGVYRAGCQSGGLMFMVAEGSPPGKSDFQDYDTALASAKKESTPAFPVKEFEIRGHRAFRASQPSDSTVTTVEFVDFHPGKIIILAVVEPSESKMASADRPTARLLVAKFLDSFELLTP